MSDLTSLHKNKPKRDFSIQACADCINKIALQFPNEFKEGFFTNYFDIAGGTQPPKSAFINEEKDGYVKFLQIRDFSSDSTPTFIPISKSNKICSEKDLVLGRYGASVGKILTGKAGAYNVACAKIIFLDESNFDREFLFYWLHSSYFQNFLTSISRSAQGGFNKNDLSRIRTRFPSVGLQRKLSKILKEIDLALLNDNKIILEKKGKTEIEIAFIKLVEKFLSFINEGEELSSEFSHQLTQVKKIRQQLLHDAVQGKLVKQDPNDEPASELMIRIKAEKDKSKKGNIIEPKIETLIPYQIPDNWIWCKFGEVVQMTRGKFSIRPRNDPRYFGGEYPFIQIGSLDVWGNVINDSKQTLNENGIKVSKKFPKNTIAIAIVGGTIGNLGVLGKEMYFTDSIIGILPKEFYNQEYVLSYLRYKQPEIKAEAYQMAGQPNIKIPTLENLLFPMPPLTEQTRIVQKIDELMQYCNDLESSIKQSDSLNEKLLKQVLREALRK